MCERMLGPFFSRLRSGLQRSRGSVSHFGARGPLAMHAWVEDRHLFGSGRSNAPELEPEPPGTAVAEIAAANAKATAETSRIESVCFEDPPAVADGEAPERPTAVADHADDDSDSEESGFDLALPGHVEARPTTFKCIECRRQADYKCSACLALLCCYHIDEHLDWHRGIIDPDSDDTDDTDEDMPSLASDTDEGMPNRERADPHTVSTGVRLQASGQWYGLKFEDFLRQPPVAGAAVAEGLERRTSHEHFVVRGQEQSVVLIAARKDNATSLELLDHAVYDDDPHREQRKTKWRGRGRK